MKDSFSKTAGTRQQSQARHDLYETIAMTNRHECRHALRSRLDSAGENKKCADIIIDHKSKDVSECVYNHKTIEELKQAIERISRW